MASAAEIAETVAGLDDIGVLAGRDKVLSGFFGRTETRFAVRDAVTLIKRRNPHAVYHCDPVMGNAGDG